MSFSFGKSTGGKFQAMVGAVPEQSVLKDIKTYGLNVQEAAEVAEGARNVMEAYLALFKTKSFAAVFYNYESEKDEFEKVVCRSFEDLQKKADEQEKDLKRLGCIANALDKALLEIQDERAKNKAFLKDILLRQMHINLSIINKLKASTDMGDNKLLDGLSEVRDNLQQSPNKINSYQLKAYVDTQMDVLYHLLEKVDGYM